jgi:NAD(P)-dependent dehydrogenase (short-subunit alcohol dehydrogenase family)
MDINGKTAIITGGASGLGEATVRLFHKLGANVTILDMNDELGNKLASDLGSNALFAKADVTDEDAVRDVIATTEEAFGNIHIVCNFAGVAPAIKTYGKNGPHPLDVFQKTIGINLIGTFNVARLASESMFKNDPVTDDGQRGVIINTASVAAFEGQMGQAAYSASKGGVVGMTLPIARDLASIGVRCNTIAPGLIHTPLFNNLPENAVQSLSEQPLNPRRLGQPSEIARTAQFIVENDYVNGEVIRVDGGIRMQAR